MSITHNIDVLITCRPIYIFSALMSPLLKIISQIGAIIIIIIIIIIIQKFITRT